MTHSRTPGSAPSRPCAFRPRVAEIGGRASDGFVSMRIYDEPPGDGPRPDAPFEQWAAVEVEAPGEVPAGMEAVTLEGGDYAVFTYRGRADGFMDVARWFYLEWLPGSGYRVADRPHFERLGPGYRPDDPEATERVWIPVEARNVG